MSKHSPQAIAAYPDDDYPEWARGPLHIAFDRGMAERQTVTREALIEALLQKREHRIGENGRGGYRCKCGAEFDWTSAEQERALRHKYGSVADAILAAANIFEDKATVQAEQIEKDAAIAEGGIDPVVDRELGARWQRSKIAALIRAQLTEGTDQ